MTTGEGQRPRVREALLTTAEAAAALGWSKRWVHVLVTQGRFEGAFRQGRLWMIPHEWVLAARRWPPGRRADLPLNDGRPSVTGFCGTREAARQLGTQPAAVSNAAAAGRLPGARKDGGMWLIPQDSVTSWKQSRSASAEPSARAARTAKPPARAAKPAARAAKPAARAAKRRPEVKVTPPPRGPRALDRAVGERDGFGRFGVLEVTEDGLVCHECGQTHRHLGLHVARAHGGTADAYRELHGLARSRGLVADDLHEVIAGNARARMDDPAGARFIAARDPSQATAARLRGWVGHAPEVLAAQRDRTRALGRSTRRPVVVRCALCGSRFCPLPGTKRGRRFCSRSCASRFNRRRRL